MASADSDAMDAIPVPPSYPPPAPPTRAPPLPPPPRSPLSIPPSTPSVEAFFTRCGLPPRARRLCWDFIHTHYPTATTTTVHECPAQGYCSYTLCIDDTRIVQFRPRAHQLNTVLALLAREVYGVLAPETRFLGVLPITAAVASCEPDDRNDRRAPRAAVSQQPSLLYVYAMTRVPGVSLTDFRRSASFTPGEARLQRAVLVRDFARFLALGWRARRERAGGLSVRKAGSNNGSSTSSNANSAGGGGGGGLPFQGRLGGSLRRRLELMRDGLPPRFRPLAAATLKALPRIEALPWVLTHGDVVPDNVMVERGGPAACRGTGWWPGSLRGMLDWAEAEYLPFGVGLYGLEELLGQGVRRWDAGADADGKAVPSSEGTRFAYYLEAGDLRRLFWQELENAIPPLAADRELRAAVEQARVLGILLWHGFAFDDGALDRVVREGRDDGEIQKLDMFLFGTDHPQARSTADLRVAAAAGEKDAMWRQSVVQLPLPVGVVAAESEKDAGKGGRNLRRRISRVLL